MDPVTDQVRWLLKSMSDGTPYAVIHLDTVIRAIPHIYLYLAM